MKIWSIAFIFSLLLLSINCGSPSQTDSVKSGTAGPVRVTVSILPQQYFVKRIAGRHAAVTVMIPPGHSPATYEPTPRQIKELSDSQLYFRIGHIPFETVWMNRLASANKTMKLIDTSTGVALLGGHEDGHEGAHHHGAVDPHIWLSPRAVKKQALSICNAFIAIDSAHEKDYRSNYDSFIKDINILNQQLTNGFQELSTRKFMVFHPSWGYLARDFNLEQLPVEHDGKAPSPAALKQVIDTARKEGVRVIFVQKQFDTHSAEAVAADINGNVIQLDPLALDWLDNMKKIARQLKEALK